MRPSTIQRNHYGKENLKTKQLEPPTALHTGGEAVLAANWKPLEDEPSEFLVYEIHNGVGDGSASHFASLKEAEAYFNERY